MGNKIIRWGLRLLCIYLLFALLTSTLAHILPKRVQEKSKQLMNDPLIQQHELADTEDRITLIRDMSSAFNIRVELLREAQSSIDFVCHTIHADESAAAFFGELLRAADRGVTIRILLDGKVGTMSKETKNIVKMLSGHKNITCCRYNPIRLLRPWEWHTLLHDKFIIMDGKWLLLGGRNLGDRYFAPEGFAGSTVDDWEALVLGEGEGSVLPQIQEYMESLWSYTRTLPYGVKRESQEDRLTLLERTDSFAEQNPGFYEKSLAQYQAEMVNATVTLLHNPIHTGQKEPRVGYQLREIALQAEESVVVQTPYSTANQQLLDTLLQVSEKTDIVMLTNSMASSPNLPAFSNYHYNRRKFLATGVALYEYQSEHSIHGKAMVFDSERSVIGSLNLDDRSLYIDTETMLLVDSPAFAEILTDAMGVYQDQSLKVGMDNKYEEHNSIAPLPVKVSKQALMCIVSLFSRLFQFLI